MDGGTAAITMEGILNYRERMASFSKVVRTFESELNFFRVSG
jgi:hypothetical protein